MLGDRESAVRTAGEALELGRRLGCPYVVVRAVMVPARDAVFQKAAEACDLWEEAVAAARQMGDDVLARFGLLYLAYLGASGGDFPAAAATWLEGHNLTTRVY